MIWDIIEDTGFDRHFSNQDTTITTLLLDQNIITELKNQNPKLLNYLQDHKHEFIVKLIEYTVVMPFPTDTYDRGHRLPYISSELLSLDSDLIYKQFFKEGELDASNAYWSQLLSFLDGSGAQNEVLVGYFKKVMNNLYQGNKARTTTIVADNLSRFTRWINNQSIVQILKKCLVIFGEPDGTVLDQRRQILQRMIAMFAKQEEQTKAICGDILAQLVNKFQAISSGDQLIQELLASELLHSIYDIPSSEAVSQFLVTLLKKTQQRICGQNDEWKPVLTLPISHRSALEGYLKRQAGNIRNISKSTGFIVNQNKQTVRKSNKSLYPILQLLGLALQEQYSSFVDHGLISFLWNLVLLYPYNDILHGFVRKIFKGIINCNVIEAVNIFLQDYQSYVLNLGKQHLVMLRSFLYHVWVEARKHDPVTTDPNILNQFQEFVKTNFEPLLQYQTKKVQKSAAKPQKLVVDQEDSPAMPKDTIDMMMENVQIEEPVQEAIKQVIQKKEDFSALDNDFFTAAMDFEAPKSKTKSLEVKKDPMQFFSVGGSGKVGDGGKKDLFSDFATFF